MTEAEARRLAAEEGLQRGPADNATGWKGVSSSSNSSSNPFMASIRQDGKKHLGVYTSAAEAALAVARFLGPEGCAGAARQRAALCGAVPSLLRTTARGPVRAALPRSSATVNRAVDLSLGRTACSATARAVTAAST